MVQSRKSSASSIAAALLFLWPLVGQAQQAPFNRLPAARFDVTAPSTRVAGTPGTMTPRETTCRTTPTSAVRQRIVDVAVQEWAYFGFQVIDRTRLAESEQDDEPAPQPRRRPRLPPEEAARVASSIAGFWTATPSAGWALAGQNEEWNGPDGVGARWQYPWSAAFISWVMCESGLGNMDQFRRAVAHHSYIDQAIRARSGEDASAAFVAREVGETPVEPGDLLCSARRPAYRTIAERQRRLGEGARTHCDVVVGVDATSAQIFAIGGNVNSRVSLKMLPGQRVQGTIRPVAILLGRRGLSAFAHLELRGPATNAGGMDRSPTVRALACAGDRRLLALPALSRALRDATACTE